VEEPPAVDPEALLLGGYNGVYQDLSGSPMHLIGWHRHAQRCGRDGKQSQDWVFRWPTDDGNESNANTFW
jgi:hypothetical protein